MKTVIWHKTFRPLYILIIFRINHSFFLATTVHNSESLKWLTFEFSILLGISAALAVVLLVVIALYLRKQHGNCGCCYKGILWLLVDFSLSLIFLEFLTYCLLVLKSQDTIIHRYINRSANYILHITHESILW